VKHEDDIEFEIAHWSGEDWSRCGSDMTHFESEFTEIGEQANRAIRLERGASYAIEGLGYLSADQQSRWSEIARSLGVKLVALSPGVKLIRNQSTADGGVTLQSMDDSPVGRR